MNTQKIQQIVPSDNIEIHFDVPNKMISAKTLSEVASGLQEMTDVIFHERIKEGDKAEVYLLVPKDGCYEAIFKIVFFTLKLGVGVLATAYISTLIKRMTGKGLTEIGNQLANKTMDGLTDAQILQRITTATAAFLSSPMEDCIEEEIQANEYKKEFEKLQLAKSHVYEPIERDDRISRISFDGDRYINRPEFKNYIRDIDNPEDDEIVQIGYYRGKIKIISLVSLREKSTRWWSCVFLSQGRNKNEVSFAMDDDIFKQYAVYNNMKLVADDVADVQMIQDNDLTPQWRLINVIEYGGEKISEPLSPPQVDALSIRPIQQDEQKEVNMLKFFEDSQQ